MVKHRRHLAPNEDTKSRIFGDTASSTTAAASNATKDEKSSTVMDQENKQPSLAADVEEANQPPENSSADGIPHPRFPRGGNRRNAHTPF